MKIWFLLLALLCLARPALAQQFEVGPLIGAGRSKVIASRQVTLIPRPGDPARAPFTRSYQFGTSRTLVTGGIELGYAVRPWLWIRSGATVLKKGFKGAGEMEVTYLEFPISLAATLPKFTGQSLQPHVLAGIAVATKLECRERLSSPDENSGDCEALELPDVDRHLAGSDWSALLGAGASVQAGRGRVIGALRYQWSFTSFLEALGNSYRHELYILTVGYALPLGWSGRVKG